MRTPIHYPTYFYNVLWERTKGKKGKLQLHVKQMGYESVVLCCVVLVVVVDARREGGEGGKQVRVIKGTD